MGKSPNNRIGWINTLKGIACWVVFLGHFDDDFPYIPVVQRFYEKGDLIRFVSEKTTALNIFYVISAFLVAYGFLKEDDKFLHKAGKGILKRYFRLALPVLFTNFLIIIIQVAGFGFGNELGMFGSKYTVPAAIWDAMVAGPFFGSVYFNPNMWMLNQLFIGYVFAIVICMVIKHLKKTAGNVFLIALTAVLWISGSWLTPFVFGVFLYLVNTRAEADSKGNALKNCFGVLLVIAGCLLASYCRRIVLEIPESVPETPLRIWFSYCWLAAMVLVLGIVLSPALKHVLEIGFLPKLGAICFPVYLFHRIWMASFGVLAFSHVFDSTQSKDKANLAAFVTCFLLTIISSFVYICLLEPPINKLTDKIMTRVSK